MSRNHIKATSIIDTQTGGEVFTSALRQFQLAGWENFQDSQYTQGSPLLLLDGVSQKVTFTAPLIFPNFERQPRRGSTLYPLYDFTGQKIITYDENNLCNYALRLQLTCQPTTAPQGMALEASLEIPSVVTIYRHAQPLSKGTDPQRMVYSVDFFADERTRDEGVEVWLTALGTSMNVSEFNIYVRSF